MNQIINWANSLITVIIFASVAELILPENSFRKYLRLAVGIIVIIMIATPLLGIKPSDVIPPTIDLDSLSYNGDNLNMYKQVGSVFSERLSHALNKTYGFSKSKVYVNEETLAIERIEVWGGTNEALRKVEAELQLPSENVTYMGAADE